MVPQGWKPAGPKPQAGSVHNSPARRGRENLILRKIYVNLKNDIVERSLVFCLEVAAISTPVSFRLCSPSRLPLPYYGALGGLQNFYRLKVSFGRRSQSSSEDFADTGAEKFLIAEHGIGSARPACN
jgi:hypothetical protein